MNQRQAEDECWKVEKQRLVGLCFACFKENEELVGWSPSFSSGRRRKRVRVRWRLLNLLRKDDERVSFSFSVR